MGALMTRAITHFSCAKLVGGVMVLLGIMTGCSSPELEMTNARLVRSRLLFVQEDKYTVMAPPLFSGSSELSSHRDGADSYEKRFKAQFPPRQEDWLASFRPIQTLPDALLKESEAIAVATTKTPGGSAAPSGPQRTYYLIPLEGTELGTIQSLESTIKKAGFECVANKPGDATRLPMPPRGTPRK